MRNKRAKTERDRPGKRIKDDEEEWKEEAKTEGE